MSFKMKLSPIRKTPQFQIPNSQFLILALALFIGLASCKPSARYQQHYTIPNNAWDYSYRPTFKFRIDSVSVAYQLFFLIRHTDAYPFNNIWMKVDIKQPGDTGFTTSRIELPLAVLSGAQTGRWLGKGTGGIWEYRSPLGDGYGLSRFSKPGEYELRLGQDMRVNPLPEVLQIGLRLDLMPVKPTPEAQ